MSAKALQRYRFQAVAVEEYTVHARCHFCFTTRCDRLISRELRTNYCMEPNRNLTKERKEVLNTYDSLVHRFHHCTNDIHCIHSNEKYSCRCRTGTAYEHCSLQRSCKALNIKRTLQLSCILIYQMTLFHYHKQHINSVIQ